MLVLSEELEIYLWSEVADMRKGFDSLSELVKKHGSNQLIGSQLVYVFLNRRLDRVKLLYWDKDGYCTWYKRLEVGRFKYKFSQGVIKVSSVDLKSLLLGMDFERIKFRKEVREGVFTEQVL